jgi:RND family efflux transporter MFP subunit
VLLPRAELQDAWDQFQDAEESLSDATRAASSGLTNAEKALIDAQSAVAEAEETLALMLDPAEYRSRKAALDEAEARRDEAEAALTQVAAGAESKVNGATAALDIARQDLADAESALENSTMTASFDGVVEAVNVEAGDEVTGTQVVVVVVNKSALAVEAAVDEEDILSVRVGAPASVTLDAVAGRVFTGAVTSIGQAQESQQGAVTFPVTITLDSAAGVSLVEGLTAGAQVINSQTPNVLRVPVAAVAGSFLQPAVERVTEDGSEMVPVQLGASNGTFVEVVSGLNEGDTVIATFATGLGLNTGSGQTLTPIGGGAFGGPVVLQGSDGSFEAFPGGGGGGRFPGGGANR